MSMDSKTLVLDVLRSLGQREAAELREGEADMDGTAIIAMERAVPAWDKQQDYTGWPVGAPVADDGQVWTLIQPHRAADYEGRPSTLRALWGLTHTKDATRAVGRPCRSEWNVHDRRVLPGRRRKGVPL